MNTSGGSTLQARQEVPTRTGIKRPSLNEILPLNFIQRREPIRVVNDCFRELGTSAYTNALMSKNIVLYLKIGYLEMGRRPHPTRAGSTIVDMAKRH